MANARRKANEPNAKRPGENEWSYRARLVREKQNQRDENEPIVTHETAQHGDYANVTILDPTGETRNSAKTVQRKFTPALLRLNMRGVITDDQLYAAEKIAMVIESIDRETKIGGASLEARVDCSNSGGNAYLETLYRVRLHRAYSDWRSALPAPKQMIIDMIRENRGLADIARRHNKSWVKAIAMLKDALDDWEGALFCTMNQIDQEDLDRVEARLCN